MKILKKKVAVGPYRSFPQFCGTAGRMDGSEVVF